MSLCEHRSSFSEANSHSCAPSLALLCSPDRTSISVLFSLQVFLDEMQMPANATQCFRKSEAPSQEVNGSKVIKETSYLVRKMLSSNSHYRHQSSRTPSNVVDDGEDVAGSVDRVHDTAYHAVMIECLLIFLVKGHEHAARRSS